PVHAGNSLATLAHRPSDRTLAHGPHTLSHQPRRHTGRQSRSAHPGRRTPIHRRRLGWRHHILRTLLLLDPADLDVVLAGIFLNRAVEPVGEFHSARHGHQGTGIPVLGRPGLRSYRNADHPRDRTLADRPLFRAPAYGGR